MTGTWYRSFNPDSGRTRGGIMGMVLLEGCIKLVGRPVFGESEPAVMGAPTEPERSFGDYTPGRYAWVLSNPDQREIMPWKGALGLWNVEWPP